MKWFLYQCLHDDTNERFSRTQGVIAFFVVLSVGVSPVQYFMEGSGSLYFWYVFTRVMVMIFSLEFVLKLYSAPHWRKYLFSPRGMVDLFSVVPFFLYQLGLITKFWALGLRGIRLLKLLFWDHIHHVQLERIQQKGHYGPVRFHSGEKLSYIARRCALLFLLEITFTTFLLSLVLVAMAYAEWEWIAIIFGAPFLLMIFLLYLRAWFNHHYDAIYITDQRIIIEDKELFGAILNEMPLRQITNVVPDTRGIINTVLGMGSIYIETSSAEDKVGFRYVRNPYHVVDVINAQRIESLKT